jgi:hypothetical protein
MYHRATATRSRIQHDAYNPLTRTQPEVSWRTVVPACMVLALPRAAALYSWGDEAGLRMLAGLVGAVAAWWCLCFVQNRAGGAQRGVNAEFGRVVWAHLAACLADALAEYAHARSPAWAAESADCSVLSWLMSTWVATYAFSLAQVLGAYASGELALALHTRATRASLPPSSQPVVKPYERRVFLSIVLMPLGCTFVSWSNVPFPAAALVDWLNVIGSGLLAVALLLHALRQLQRGVFSGRLLCMCRRASATSFTVAARPTTGAAAELEKLLREERLGEQTCWYLSFVRFPPNPCCAAR